jgi:hypothetical protein
MPRVQYLGTGGYHIRDGPDFDEVGDEQVVGERTADRLCARDDFERVTTDAEDAGDDAGEGEPFDVEAWLDQEYRTRTERVVDGDVDHILDTIADIETSQTVLDAVDDRRDELERT